jgi:SAM-dependent methyltransferase
MKILKWLKLPETRHIKDLDSPATTLLHAQIVKNKPFLRKLYTDFYKELEKAIGRTDGKMLVELGSGGGFIKEIIPNVITSDILELPNVDKVFSATEMPFEDGSVGAFLMIDVLHHITEPKAFFAEAIRSLDVTGKIAMIEPANTLWARFIYSNFHHELFETQADWSLQAGGPLSTANGALPWIIFSRDRQIFEQQFPSLRIKAMRNHTPFRYPLSGGLSYRQLVPSFTYQLVKAAEFTLSPVNNWLGMFQTIVLEKVA